LNGDIQNELSSILVYQVHVTRWVFVSTVNDPTSQINDVKVPVDPVEASRKFSPSPIVCVTVNKNNLIRLSLKATVEKWDQFGQEVFLEAFGGELG
jgi:hypothetical protein